MKQPSIISLGEVLWDLFPDGERFGGAPANLACHAAILGGDVLMVSAVGDDRHGRDAIGLLNGYGIDVSLMQIVPDAPTGTVGFTQRTSQPDFAQGVCDRSSSLRPLRGSSQFTDNRNITKAMTPKPIASRRDAESDDAISFAPSREESSDLHQSIDTSNTGSLT